MQLILLQGQLLRTVIRTLHKELLNCRTMAFTLSSVKPSMTRPGEVTLLYKGIGCSSIVQHQLSHQMEEKASLGISRWKFPLM